MSTVTQSMLRFNRRPVPVNKPGTFPGMIETYTDWTDQLPHDGWMYDTEILYLPYRYDAFALVGATVMRNANLVRAKNWVVPVTTLTVPAYDTYEVQLPLLEGTRVWGARYIQFSTATGGTEIAPTGAQCQLTDACSGVPFWQDFVDCAMFSTYTGVTGRRAGNGTCVLLTTPRLVTGAGNLNVELANTTNADLYCQLTLFCAELCELVQSPDGPAGSKVSTGAPVVRSAYGRRA